MKKKLRSYQGKLLKDLRDPDLAHHYPNEALADEDPRMFLLALKNVHGAQCSKDHTPNDITKKAIEAIKTRKNLQTVDNVKRAF
jgi:hypothetical protein